MNGNISGMSVRVFFDKFAYLTLIQAQISKKMARKNHLKYCHRETSLFVILFLSLPRYCIICGGQGDIVKNVSVYNAKKSE